MIVLVAYASATGATQNIAEQIANRLTAAQVKPSITTILHSLSEPQSTEPSPQAPASYADIDLEPYDAIIIGSAINGMKWLPMAEKFVSKLEGSSSSRSKSIAGSEEVEEHQQSRITTTARTSDNNQSSSSLDEGKPIFAFSVGAPHAMPLGIGNALARSEQKRLDKWLRTRLEPQLRGHQLFDGVWHEEMIGRGSLAKFWRGLWGCLGGKFGDFTNLGEVDRWVDAVVVPQLQPQQKA